MGSKLACIFTRGKTSRLALDRSLTSSATVAVRVAGRADDGFGHSARGGQAAPYDTGDVRRVIATLPGVSMRRVCGVLKFSRARLRARAVSVAAPPGLDEVLAERIQRLIELHPTFGYRRCRQERAEPGVEERHASQLPARDCGTSGRGRRRHHGDQKPARARQPRHHQPLRPSQSGDEAQSARTRWSAV